MSYRNKTYVIFDADEDMWAYAYMKGWKANTKVDFNFLDAHDIKPLTDRASDDTIRQRLRERMANAKQVIVLVGEHTKGLRKFIPLEIEMALSKELPIIVVNLNGKRDMDAELCPTALTDAYAVHVPFKMKIIKHALDQFPDQHAGRKPGESGPFYYADEVYRRLEQV